MKILRLYKSRTSILTNGPIGKYYKGGFENNMSKREAYLILGISSRATEEELKNAHKKLMLLNHPDSGIVLNFFLKLKIGGSTYISTKLNNAKEHILLY